MSQIHSWCVQSTIALTGLKSSAVWLTLCAYLLFVGGCSTTIELTADPNDTQSMREGRIISATSKSGEIIKFNKIGGRVVEKTEGHSSYYAIIAGVTDDGRMVELAPDSLLQVKIEHHKANVGGTVGIVLLATVVVASAVMIPILVSGLNHN